MILDKTYLGSTEIEKVYLGNDVVYELTPSVSNLYSWSDAATPTPNEANTIFLDSLNGWSTDGSATISSTSSDVDPIGGTYSIAITQVNIGGNDGVYLNFTAEIGETYRFTYWAKKSSGSDGVIRGSLGWSGALGGGGIAISEAGGVNSIDLTADATQTFIRVLANRATATGIHTTWMDNITMIKL